MNDEPSMQGDPPPDGDPRVPDLHLERLEAMARRAPRELARRADEAIARRAPALAPSRLRGRLRRRTVALLAMLGVMAMLASAWAALRETTLLRQAIEAKLSERFGADVAIRTVRWDGWDTVTASDLDLRARGWKGDAGRVASMRRATVVFSPWHLLLGRVQPVDMEVEGLTIRLIEREDRPGDFAFLALRPKAGGGGGVSKPLSAMLHELRVEYGSSRPDGAVTLSSTQEFAAEFEHVPERPSRYEFRLEQRAQDGVPAGPEAIRITGTWDEQDFSYEARLASLRIDDPLLRALPLTARRWAMSSGLQGRIERARITGSTEHPVRDAEIVLRDVTLRERDAVRQLEWGRIEGANAVPIRGDITASLGSAEVTIAGRDLRLEAHGVRLSPGAPGTDAITVPLELSAHCDLSSFGGIEGALDADDAWLPRMLAMASYELDLRIPGVDARPTAEGRPRRVELPMDAARALAAVGARDWAADVRLSVRRAAGTLRADGIGTAAPLSVGGTLVLLDGTVESPAFRYPIRHVRGEIDLQGNRVSIRGLEGTGSGSTRLRIDGETEIGGDDGALVLHLVGQGVQLDRALIGAFSAEPSRITDLLLDDASWKSLHAAGLLDESVRPGGAVDFDISLRHARGGGERMEATGTADLRGVHVLLNAFPYPMLVDGRLSISDERVDLQPGGLSLQTLHGGRGHLSGRIDVPRVDGKRRVRSFLEFDVVGEPTSPALLAAIPPSFEDRTQRPKDWPGGSLSRVSTMLTELGLDGMLNATGTVRTRPDESDAVTVNVHIADGQVRPTESLGPVLRANGLSWPGRMTLDGVSGDIIADADRVEVRGATGRHGAGTVRASGAFAIDGSGGTLDVVVLRFPFDRELVRIADGPAVDRALAAWDALAPSGTFDGEVSWNKDAGGQDTYAHVRPTALTLAGSVPLEPVCGDLFFRNGELRLEDVDLRGPDFDDSPLRIVADGAITGPNPSFHASAERVSLQSPLVDRALAAAGADAARTVLRDWALRGELGVTVDLPGPRSSSAWEVAIEPAWVLGEHGGMPFGVRFLEGALVAGPGGLRVDGVRAALDRGTVRIDGHLAPTERSAIAGELRADALVVGLSDDLRALMPVSVREALGRLEFGTDSPIWASGMRILLDAPREAGARVSVVGNLGIADAHFRAGVDFDRIDGTLAFDLTSEADAATGTIGLRLDQARAMSRRATDLAGELVFEPGGTIRLERTAASMYGGRVAATGAYSPAHGWDVHVMAADVGFSRFVAAGATQAPVPAAADTTNATPATPPPADTGLLRGRVDVRGRLDDPSQRRGSGKVAVEDARMMEFPLGMSFLQLTQLMLPLNASMDRGFLDFDIDDRLLNLRRIELSSGTLRFEGSGEVSTDTGALALRFRSRGRLPLLSDLYGVFSDQFFAVDVGGTLSDPQPRLTPIPVFAPAPSASADGGHGTGTEQR